MRRLHVQVALVTTLAVAAVTGLAWSSERSTTPPSAKALEATLLAPCCWNGTLATHDSPLASELRTEIETREGKGETTAAIEADLVTRYGDRVRAMPRAGAFSNALVLALDLLIVAIGALTVILARWRRNAVQEKTATAPARVNDDYDDRIDAELAELEAD